MTERLNTETHSPVGKIQVRERGDARPSSGFARNRAVSANAVHISLIQKK